MEFCVTNKIISTSAKMRNPYFHLLATAWKYARHEKKKFIIIYSMFVVSNVIVATNPLFYGWFVNKIQQHGIDALKVVCWYALGFLGLRLFEWAFHGPARVMERQLAFNVSRNFQDELLNKVLNLPVSWHQQNHSGATINKLRKAYEALRDFYQNGFIYLYSFGKFLFSFTAMIYFSPIFGSIGILLGAITVFIIVQFDKPFVRTQREVNQREHKVSSILFDTLSNITSVITLRLEQRVHSSVLAKVGEVFPPFKKNVTINELKWFTAQMMVGLIYAVTVFGYVYQHWVPGETFQIGGLIILIGYVTQFTSVFNDIASQYTQIVRYYTEIQNVKDVEKAFDEMPERRAAIPLSPGWKHLDIEHVNFIRAEKAGGKPVGLFDLGIRIKKGERIALIGESGSGKSTLLTVLRGLHKPQPGASVTVDDNSQFPIESIVSTVTLFPQEPEIFENTILYNITLGLPFTEDEVMTVCEEAHFADVVRRLPQGLNTHIQEKGVNLSGGQKQRLALARGILASRSSEIILMDEPTSSVDPRTEKAIYSNMFRAFDGKAVVSSLHRLHLLSNFDYVYILNNGTIIDEGTFDDLKRYSLVFKDMWDHQKPEPVETMAPEEFPKLNVAL
jgi:ATP-binding cassette subfamily B protein